MNAKVLIFFFFGRGAEKNTNLALLININALELITHVKCETEPRGFVLKCLKKFFVLLGNMFVFSRVHLPDVVAFDSLLLPLFFNMFSELKLNGFF